MAYVGQYPCLLRDRHECDGYVSLHHVKSGPGALKDDRRVVPLCLAGHLHGFGMESVEQLGKKFEAHHGVSLEGEITRLQTKYLLEHPEVKWD